MNIDEILTATIVLTSIFAYVNHRWIKWPPTIGIMVLALLFSIFLAILGKFDPALTRKAVLLVASIDFHKALMNFMLSFLLFAGAIHINSNKLKKERWPIIILSTIGTILSTFFVGALSWYLFKFFGINIDFIYCLLFGALISPTDPIAVLSILKAAKIPSSLEIKISGESLFNDGVAVVLFISISEMAKNGTADFHVFDLVKLFMQEAVGGLLFGAVLGYMGYWTLRSIDNYTVEILITLAIVMGGYSIAGFMHISGPLAMVVAGIITGNKVKDEVMSDITQDYLSKFWELIDEILNAVLFLLIGMEMLIIKINSIVFLIGMIIILVVLLARWISVIIPVYFLKPWIIFEKNVVPILTWGGLRGGLSVALALSLSPAMHKDEFVLVTYIVVVFSILVQGLTIGDFVRRLAAKEKLKAS
ncbi:sodium:proton antiporter [Mucilaginibacter sp.]|uniref:cation:proton antiporter n=1 Tax=Mucilaginibacter sp. TaxID=1882438 RepID=UPI00283B79E8|nr:sodium:proton antiporter [Mucilaginibacter sp.]MDR3695219.1 sodium:proton antiporter [Mucilaginibacter sp.]